MTGIRHIVLSIIRKSLLISGSLFLLLLIFSFTRVPFDIHRWLGTKDAKFNFQPTTIVMLGGSGMPSESNLIRLFYIKELALKFPKARIIIAHPDDPLVLEQMTGMLLAYGVDSLKIFSGSHGTNTREQAMQLKDYYDGIVTEKVVLVTSPEHVYRSVNTFRKLGFQRIGGVGAFENAMFVDLGYNHQKLGGKKYIPDVSGNLGIRYNSWNYFKLEITCLREFVAILYYRVNGWM